MVDCGSAGERSVKRMGSGEERVEKRFMLAAQLLLVKQRIARAPRPVIESHVNFIGELNTQ